MYRDAHFRWDKHIVNGTEHKICKAKVVKSEALSEEILMMVGFALRAGLMNTSCWDTYYLVKKEIIALQSVEKLE